MSTVITNYFEFKIFSIRRKKSTELPPGISQAAKYQYPLEICSRMLRDLKEIVTFQELPFKSRSRSRQSLYVTSQASMAEDRPV